MGTVLHARRVRLFSKTVRRSAAPLLRIAHAHLGSDFTSSLLGLMSVGSGECYIPKFAQRVRTSSCG